MRKKSTELVSANSRARWAAVSRNWQLYILVAIPVAWLILFRYFPMYGNIIVFKKYVPALGMWGSPWTGFENIIRFIQSYKFEIVIWNTLYLNLYSLFLGFPIPIILALLLHYSPLYRYKKTVQMVTYAPHFISTVVMVGVIFKLLTQRIGIVNVFLVKIGLNGVNFLGSATWFPHVYVWTGIWQNMGWGTIIFLAVLSAVDPELHESAKVDGASILLRMWHIDLPTIMPTVVILLILRSGHLLDLGFEKIFLMQNNLNIRSSEVIQTYVYKIGLASSRPDFSYAASIGFFENTISFVLLLLVNRFARKVGETSLW